MTRVALLRGGMTSERKASLASGAALLEALSSRGHALRDIHVGPDGFWYERGRVVAPESVLTTSDVVLSTLFGRDGEDGSIARLCSTCGVPLAGPSALASARTLYKPFAKEVASAAGIVTPRYLLVEDRAGVARAVETAVRRFGAPLVVKPASGAGSDRIAIAHGLSELVAATDAIVATGEHALIEEFVRGDEAVVFVVEDLRGEPRYLFPTLSLSRGESGRFSVSCPSRFTKATDLALERAARSLFDALSLAHYARLDFLVRPDGSILFLEANALPRLSEQGLFRTALSTVGLSLADFGEHLIRLAQKGRG